jgi:YidC/Oxa1 family membrane protein insertase
METRRFILALSLSLLVFLVYVRFFAPPTPQQKLETIETGQTTTALPREATSSKPAVVRQRPGAFAGSIVPATAGKDIVIESDLVKVVLSTAGGVVKHWELKKYIEADKTDVGLGALYRKFTGTAKKQIEPKKERGNVQLFTPYEGVVAEEIVFPLTIVPLDRELSNVARVEYRSNLERVQLDEKTPSQTVVLTYTGPGGLLIEKSLTFHYNEYKVDLAVRTKGLEGYTVDLGTDFGISDKISSDASGRVGIVTMVDGKLVTEKLGDIKGEVQHAGAIEWLGQEDKYFTAALVHGSPGIVTITKTAAPKEIGDLVGTRLTVKDASGEHKYTLFAGPKSSSLLKAQGHGMERMIDYGWFGILAKPMFWLMQQFYAISRNYGIAIILLTIVVRLILFYPSLKSATAMEEMKKLQPQMTALREKYKKDPPKMNQEIMKLYKDHKVNPLGGCLPMVLQLPFFVALYNVLSVSIELRQSPFISFWIKDLSVFDPFYILPVLMGVSMIFTMKMTSTSVDPQQQKIMMYMNVAFIFMFAWLPAGLLLYITLSNVLSIVQQLYVRKLIGAA